MSFGEPDNPYGAPQDQGQHGGYPQQGQPGYGYPNAPQGQPGYGYPNAPQGQPGYGYPAAPPMQQPYGVGVSDMMPGNVKSARVMLWVIAGLQLLGTVLFAVSAVSINKAKNDLQDNPAFEQLQDFPTGLLWALAGCGLVWGVIMGVLATKLNPGGTGVRVTTLVFAIITAVIAVYPFTFTGIVHLVLAILIACFVGGSNGKAWFNRPRY
jgi:hypothetical protein